jgi:RNA polymerase sigma factor (sigma-70 family)
MESDISNISLLPETAIAETIGTINQALNALRMHPWLKNVTERTSTSLAWQFGLEELKPEDIQLFIIDKLVPVIHTVNNPNHRPLCECIHSWIYHAAYNYCLNVQRHVKVVRKHEEQAKHELTSGKINSVPILKSAVPTPEDQLLEKEAEEERESRTTDIRVRVRGVVMSYAPQDVSIVYLWGTGLTLQQIAARTNIPLATVSRRLKKVQKAITAELEFDSALENKVLKEGLRQLIASSLQGFVS